MPTSSVFQLYYDEQVIKYVSHHTNNVSDLNLIKKIVFCIFITVKSLAIYHYIYKTFSLVKSGFSLLGLKLKLFIIPSFSLYT